MTTTDLELWETTARAVTGQDDVTVEFADLGADVLGEAMPGAVRINSTLDPETESTLGVFLHECMHVYLGHAGALTLTRAEQKRNEAQADVLTRFHLSMCDAWTPAAATVRDKLRLLCKILK